MDVKIRATPRGTLPPKFRRLANCNWDVGMVLLMRLRYGELQVGGPSDSLALSLVAMPLAPTMRVERMRDSPVDTFPLVRIRAFDRCAVRCGVSQLIELLFDAGVLTIAGEMHFIARTFHTSRTKVCCQFKFALLRFSHQNHDVSRVY
jgi:hypothetical protein